MNATLKAKTAYASTTAPTRSVKSLEYVAIAKVTADLRITADNQENDFPSFVKALEKNRKLWQIFAVDVSSTGNRLPPQLRAQIFYLAEFTFQHTKAVLARKADVSDLVEVNTSILRGLNVENT